MNSLGPGPIPKGSAGQKLSIAVIGTGISGMSAAWLLNNAHDVTVYEKDDRIGGHSNTVTASDGVTDTPVDTGFIVYNEKNYPNLIALFDHLGVPTAKTDMSFGVSLENGGFEYSGSDFGGLFAQPRNIFSPRFWAMLKDIMRFYREAPKWLQEEASHQITLGDFLKKGGYSKAFANDHLLPMGAAIWSTPANDMLDYPMLAFTRFCDNHGLLQLSDRPQWRTVIGGSREYVNRLTSGYRHKIQLNDGIRAVWTQDGKVAVEDRQGNTRFYDHVVMACHANESLKLLRDPTASEEKLLSAIRYQPNKAILHSDPRLMPKRRRAWSSWNYLEHSDGSDQNVAVTYWMNRLQPLDSDTDWFVTLNPPFMPEEGKIQRSFLYHHPVFDKDALRAQQLIWNIQGQRNIWFAGAWLGHGFHEDGLQSGLAVAEAIGGQRRPWKVEGESARLSLPADWPQRDPQEAA